MPEGYDVIIAGAGPVGLLLACELGLAQVSVLVLERDPSPNSPWKNDPLGLRGLNTSSAESLYRRGLLGKIFDLSERPHAPQKTPGLQFGGHFAGIPLDTNRLDLDSWKYSLPGPALMPGPTTIDRMEAALTERAQSLGVTILRGHGVNKIVAQHDSGITVESGEPPKQFRGGWLVGCDGGRSTVRKAAGFDFVGTEATFTGYVVHCDLDHPENLEPGFRPTSNGMYIFRKPDTVYLMDFDDGAGQTKELSQERFQDVLNRVTGKDDVKIGKVHLATAFTDRSKQATTYRRGRVLLAGDAAHIHPPLGAQGMNTGLGDAMNLGWKLAATIRSERARGAETDLSLLDTYERERHPIGAWVLEWNQAQVATLQPNPTGRAVQKLVRNLINTDDGTSYFLSHVWGTAHRYDLGDGEHALVGRSVPDFTFKNGTRIGSRMEGPKGLLVEFDDEGSLKELVTGERYEDKVEYVGLGVEDRRGIRAVLVRPDGFVAWATAENAKPDIGALEVALEWWFGF